jgi:hypothetical protein
MAKWEYTTHKTTTMAAGIEDLAAFGRDGWELIHVVSETDRYGVTFIFKRELQATTSE